MDASNANIANLIIQGAIAVGTISVAILAIWGDWVRNKIAKPKLDIKLYNTRGDLTSLQDRSGIIYYHIKVDNKRKWSTAKHVKILCTEIYKKASDGSFLKEDLVVPVQLQWAFPTLTELFPNISDYKICDLGYVAEKDDKFILALYGYPNNFKGFVKAGEAMRIKLYIDSENFPSSSPYLLDIYWDGKWSSNLEEMQKHLIIKEAL